LIALPDVNVLLALVWSNHPHHDAAHEWFGREASSGWATCLLTQTAFLRLSLNPQVVGVAIDCVTVVQLLGGIAAHPQHRFLDAAPALNTTSFDELIPRIVGYRQVSDATLLHLARCHSVKLVTFDQSIASICPWQESLLVLSPHQRKLSP
jgi:toxin-antitoxin system PIN domain toxin